MDLFQTDCLHLLDDAEGGVRYRPGFLAADAADRCFADLLAFADWQAQRRPMYDQVVDVPRLLASYRTVALPADLPLADLLARVEAAAPAPYNAIGLNLYRDGRDSVAMHGDKLHTLVPGHPIALVSLGDARRMQIRARTGRRERIAIELEHGSLLVMSHAVQVSHEHGIAKTARPVGPRISVVFRVRPGGYRGY